MRNSFVVIFLIISCTSLEKEFETHLKYGLNTYHRTHIVNSNFVPGISLKKLAIIRKNGSERILVLKLNDEVTADQINLYSLAIKIYLDKNKHLELLRGQDYISRPIKPSLLAIGNHKYILTPLEVRTDKVEKFEFFFFDRDKFRKVLSKPVFVKDVMVK